MLSSISFFIEVTLGNNIIHISGVGYYHSVSVHTAARSPPKVQFPSVTVYLTPSTRLALLPPPSPPATTIPFSVSTSLLSLCLVCSAVSLSSRVKSYYFCPFPSCLFHIAKYSQDPWCCRWHCLVVFMAEQCSMGCLYPIFFILSSADGQREAVSISWLLSIMLDWTDGCTYLSKLVFSYSLGKSQVKNF